MTNIFQEAVATVADPSIEAWRNAGRKVVGYTCSYVPGEVFQVSIDGLATVAAAS